jgi:type IV secretory pathway TrbD component
VFSVGLWHSFQQPEVSMFGLQMPDMGTWINRIGEQIKAGHPPRPLELRSGILEGFDVQWRAVNESWYRALFGYGIWFYQSWFPMLQMVWPDRAEKWP